jgi:hypothetical protein
LLTTGVTKNTGKRTSENQGIRKQVIRKSGDQEVGNQDIRVSGDRESGNL